MVKRWSGKLLTEYIFRYLILTLTFHKDYYVIMHNCTRQHTYHLDTSTYVSFWSKYKIQHTFYFVFLTYLRKNACSPGNNRLIGYKRDHNNTAIGSYRPYDSGTLFEPRIRCPDAYSKVRLSNRDSWG